MRDAERSTAIEPSCSATFRLADANRQLDFEEGTFDAIISIDAINHLEDRLSVLREFHRVLKPAGRLLFTDPITVTGILTRDEIATRSQIGPMNFTPLGENEKLLQSAGFEVRRVQDVTANAAITSGRRRDAREKYRAELVQIEGEPTFSDIQRFLTVAHQLSSERRLSRLVFLAVKT
ncbi:MAG: class I SAM-dependent methyltransferase [Acidobacteriota bacterium]